MKPRLGFLGVGWIGRNRMEALVQAAAAAAVAVADADPSAATIAAGPLNSDVVTPEQLLHDYDEMDGIVIATPSALHAEQAQAALARGIPVFCQKPLARTAAECEGVVEAARAADRLLGVDLSYRHLDAVTAVRQVLEDGGIGDVYAADLVFHNAYGPDKKWFTDPAQSGGGCVIDLGIHLVDLVLWLLEKPFGKVKVEAVDARLYAQGRLLKPDPDVTEDYATARLDLSTGATLSLTCSWFLHAGVDAEIGLTLHGTDGSLAVHNVAGSFYDFGAWQRSGTGSKQLVAPPDDWGARAAIAWAHQLAGSNRFDPAVADIVDVAGVLDRVYGR